MSKERNTYFVYPMLHELEETTDRMERARLKTLIAVNVGRPEALREIFGLDSESLSDFYHDNSLKHLSTEDTIDSFLERFGDRSVMSSGKDDDVDVFEDLLPEAGVSADYFSTLSEEGGELPPVLNDRGKGDATDNLLNSFLNRHEEEPGAAEITEAENIDVTELGSESESALDTETETEPEPRSETRIQKPDITSETNTLTEGFARILIKNGNYAKAIEIIRDLNLKNPEKSVYFADQIRFLRKLMVNEIRKNGTSTPKSGK